jgi:hypothetical protein
MPNRYVRWLKEQHSYRPYIRVPPLPATCPSCGSPRGGVCRGCHGYRGLRRLCRSCSGTGRSLCCSCLRAALAWVACHYCGRFGEVEQRTVGTFMLHHADGSERPKTLCNTMCPECWRVREESGLQPAETVRVRRPGAKEEIMRVRGHQRATARLVVEVGGNP